MQAEGWTANDLVYLSRKSDGATLTLDIHVPADPDGAPLVIGAAGSTVNGLLTEGFIVVTLDSDDNLGEGPVGVEEIVGDRAFMRASAERFACAIRLARARIRTGE